MQEVIRDLVSLGYNKNDAIELYLYCFKSDCIDDLKFQIQTELLKKRDASHAPP